MGTRNGSTNLGHEAGSEATLVLVAGRYAFHDPRAWVVGVAAPAPPTGRVHDGSESGWVKTEAGGRERERRGHD